MMLRMLSAVMALLVLSIFAAVPASAQSPDMAERPSIKVGDTWSYQTVDAWTNLVQEKYKLEVSDISDKEIQLVRSSEKSGAAVKITATLDMNMLNSVNSVGEAIQYSPNEGSYTFPLVIGKKWEHKMDYATSNRSGSTTLDSKAVGWEKVKVPAGEFNALKIVREGSYRSTRTPSGYTKIVIWYVPSIKGMVKRQYEDTNSSGQRAGWITTELLSYKVD